MYDGRSRTAPWKGRGIKLQGLISHTTMKQMHPKMMRGRRAHVAILQPELIDMSDGLIRWCILKE